MHRKNLKNNCSLKRPWAAQLADYTHQTTENMFYSTFLHLTQRGKTFFSVFNFQMSAFCGLAHFKWFTSTSKQNGNPHLSDYGSCRTGNCLVSPRVSQVKGQGNFHIKIRDSTDIFIDAGKKNLTKLFWEKQPDCVVIFKTWKEYAVIYLQMRTAGGRNKKISKRRHSIRKTTGDNGLYYAS